MHWPMHQALRCHARSKRSGLRCQAPAVRGIVSVGCTRRRRAPRGNKNALKHGGSTTEAHAMKIRMARDTMAAIEP
jgi:hypothetical protein